MENRCGSRRGLPSQTELQSSVCLWAAARIISLSPPSPHPPSYTSLRAFAPFRVFAFSISVLLGVAVLARRGTSDHPDQPGRPRRLGFAVSAPGMWKLLFQSVRGTAHQRTTAPCQDSCLVRLRSTPQGPVLLEYGGALQLTTPLQEVNRQLDVLSWAVIGAGALGVIVAALLGLAVARTALRPLDELTDSVEGISAVLDGTSRLDSGSADELGRLRSAFNRLLDAVEGVAG